MYGEGSSPATRRYVDRAGAEQHAQALAQHHLERVAGRDVLLAAMHGLGKTLAGETADEIGLVNALPCRVSGTARRRGTAMASASSRRLARANACAWRGSACTRKMAGP